MALERAVASFLRRAHLLLSSAASPRAPAAFSILFSTTAAASAPSPTAHAMTAYLISKWGFSPSDAAKHSERLSHLASTSNPDAVLSFLRALGFDPVAIRGIISCRPTLLKASVTKTLEPKIASLRAAGFSDAEISTLVSGSPASLELNVVPKLQTIGAYLPSSADLLKALRLDTNLLTRNLADTLVPNAALLRAHGMAEPDIGRALTSFPRLLTRKAASFGELVDRAVALGFPLGTNKFLRALQTLSRYSKMRLLSKVEFFKSLGWSEAEFNAAFLKAPLCMSFSDEVLRTKMNFLVDEAGLDPRHVAEDPLLLMLSLEKRLAPRHRVHRILKGEGLHGSKHVFPSIVRCTDQQFLVRYVIPHLDRVPALRDIYLAAHPAKA